MWNEWNAVLEWLIAGLEYNMTNGVTNEFGTNSSQAVDCQIESWSFLCLFC